MYGSSEGNMNKKGTLEVLDGSQKTLVQLFERFIFQRDGSSGSSLNKFNVFAIDGVSVNRFC